MSKIRVSEAWIGPDKDHLEHSLCFEFNYIKSFPDSPDAPDFYRSANLAIYYQRTSKKWLGEVIEGNEYSSLSDTETLYFVEEWGLENLAEAWADIHLQQIW